MTSEYDLTKMWLANYITSLVEKAAYLAQEVQACKKTLDSMPETLPQAQELLPCGHPRTLQTFCSTCEHEKAAVDYAVQIATINLTADMLEQQNKAIEKVLADLERVGSCCQHPARNHRLGSGVEGIPHYCDVCDTEVAALEKWRSLCKTWWLNVHNGQLPKFSAINATPTSL